MFDWLKRYRECGTPCQRCAKECMVQAIHPDGHINPNECLYCLHCQVLYQDDEKCPVCIKRKQRRAPFLAAEKTKAAGRKPAAATTVKYRLTEEWRSEMTNRNDDEQDARTSRVTRRSMLGGTAVTALAAGTGALGGGRGARWPARPW